MARFHYSKAYTQYGASLGRRSDYFADFNFSKPIRLQRVPARDGGDYDPGGAYWGDLLRNPLWRAEDVDGNVNYDRAYSREHAKAVFEAKLHPDRRSCVKWYK